MAGELINGHPALPILLDQHIHRQLQPEGQHVDPVGVDPHGCRHAGVLGDGAHLLPQTAAFENAHDEREKDQRRDENRNVDVTDRDQRDAGLHKLRASSSRRRELKIFVLRGAFAVN